MESTTKGKRKKRILKLEQFDLLLTRASFNYTTSLGPEIKVTLDLADII